MIKLYELRIEKSLSQRAIAKIFNISQATYNNWENGRTEPSIQQLIEIAKYFEVSVDYLIGNSDETGIIYVKRDLNDRKQQLLEFYDNIGYDEQNLVLYLVKSLASKK